MGPKRKHQQVQQESDTETPKAKSPKSGSKKKRPRKNKNDSIVKEENSSAGIFVKAEADVGIKPGLITSDNTNDEENHIEENFSYENNDTTVASDDVVMLEPKIEQDLPTWPTNDLETLLGKIDEILPEKDNLRFKSRLAKLDWESLRFGDYSSDQCRQMWEFVQKHVRCYRLLGEIITDAKAWVSHPWTSYRNHKIKRHPDMPRRPLSCYMIYYMRNKSKVLKKNPKMDMPALSKHISEMYKKLSPAKREKYMKLAEVQRDEYLEKLREFYKKHPELEPKSQKQKMIALNVPKKPFKLYYDSKLKDADDKIDRNLFLKKCKRKWKNLSDEKKFYWIDLALSQTGKNADTDTDANDEYKKKMQNLLTKEERHLKEKIAGKPDKPPLSAYALFSKNLIGTERIQGINPKDRIAAIAQEWKKCSDQEKESWKQKLIELIDQYKKDYSAYIESLTEEERLFELLNNQPKTRKKSTKEKEDEDAGASPEGTNDPPSPVYASTSKMPGILPNVTNHKKKRRQSTNSDVIETLENNLPEEPATSLATVLPDEPEAPPAKPIELYAKELKNKSKSKKSVQDLWNELSIQEQEKYRKRLDKLKNTYIIKYEKFLKGLTPDELKLYSRMKTSQSKAAENESESESADEDESDEDSDDEDEENVKERVKKEVKSEDEDSAKSEGEAASSSEEEDDSDDSSD